MIVNAERLIVALDFDNPRKALDLADQLGKLGVGFKVGLELFLYGGIPLVVELARKYRVFLDLKYHDIPNTVAAAVRAAAALDIWMLTIHASGGRKMMLAAREALKDSATKPLLMAVTVLTSIGEDDLLSLDLPGQIQDRVTRWAKMAADCGMDGVICSPLDITAVKDAVSPTFLTVSPGIRPDGSSRDDQSRVAGVPEVIRTGGNYMVVGRPITRAADPIQAAGQILTEIGAVN